MVADAREARYNTRRFYHVFGVIGTMPTYVYGCDTCGHRFEKFQKFQDAALTECPECGAKIRRIFQPAGIVFKGSGWYYTDSRSAKQGSVSENSSNAGSTASTSDASKSDSSSKSDSPSADTKSDSTSKPASAPEPATP